jgi:hypothetical protein
MSEDKNLERAKKLLKLAGHPDTRDEEARNAAVKAARMIYEHGYVLSDPNAASAPPPAPDNVAARAAQRAAASAAATAAAASRAHENYAAQILDIFERQQPRHARRQAPAKVESLDMRSRYDGFCRACGQAYAQGERVSVKPGSGACHYACRSYWDTAR